MHKFFARPPLDVAIDLQGKTLRVGNREGIITRVKPQYPADNKNWCDRPLFGPHPVDVYAAPYRGTHLLFLRTGTPDTNTCVRIDGLETKSKAARTPGQVCKALGITSERTGKLHLSDDVISLIWS
jgi:3-methyladenine DNA glycosylase Mpg